MIYTFTNPNEPLHQGEIIDQCPLIGWEVTSNGAVDPVQFVERVIILTQACDLENPHKTRVTLAIVHRAEKLVKQGTLTAGNVRDQIRRHKQYGWYFLPAFGDFPESIVDLHDLHSVPRKMLEQLARDGRRICRLVTPYREHLAQHFSVTYSRIGLPEPYGTE